MKVNERTPEVEAMACEWPIAEALMGGTSSMRKAAEEFLPRWPKEDARDYDARLKVATLFPAFRRTVSVMAGKPFSKEIQYEGPESIDALDDDIDQQGRNLHSFLADIMSQCLSHGIAGVLVEYPVVPPGAVQSLAQERQLGLRPYAVNIKAEQLLGWKQRVEGSRHVLTQLRIMECVDGEEGEFGTEKVEQVRVIEPTIWRTFRENARKEWVLYEEGVNTLGKVPFVAFYGERCGFMKGRSPLLDLAYQNVKHWQRQSDLDNITHVVCTPILVTIGAEQEEGKEVAVGAGIGLNLPMQADMKYVEHSGKGVEAAQAMLTKLEEQMIQTGAELLVEKPGQRSATEANNEAEANKCDLQRITEAFEDSADQMMQLFADWMKLPDGGNVSLFKDFGAANLSDASAQLVLAMQQGGLISKVTAVKEYQRRGLLDPDLDPEEEIDAAGMEGPDPQTDPQADPATAE